MPVPVYRRVLRHNIQGITNPAIKRLATMAGCERVSGLVYEEIRGLISTMLHNILAESVIYMEHARRKTLSIKDFKSTLKLHNISYLGGDFVDYQICKSDEDVKKSLKSKQEGNCLYIAHLPFIRFVKEVLQDYKDSVHLTKQFVYALQYYIESEIIKFITKTNNVLRGVAQKVTISARDLSHIVNNFAVWPMK